MPPDQELFLAESFWKSSIPSFPLNLDIEYRFAFPTVVEDVFIRISFIGKYSLDGKLL